MKPVRFHQKESLSGLNYITELGRFKNQKEAIRYKQLLDIQEKGDISGLQRRVSFILIDAVYKKRYYTKVVRKNKKVKATKKVLIENAVTFEADFIYYNKKNKLRVEVVRNNYKDDAYITKRRLIKYLHQINVIEN